MKRAMVLLGAGASKEYGAPLGVGLTDIIEREVKADAIARQRGSDAAFDAIKSQLVHYLREPENLNFEQIYRKRRSSPISIEMREQLAISCAMHCRPLAQRFANDGFGVWM